MQFTSNRVTWLTAPEPGPSARLLVSVCVTATCRACGNTSSVSPARYASRSSPVSRPVPCKLVRSDWRPWAGRHHSRRDLHMKSIAGMRMLALPVVLVATVAVASAQEGAKAQARETKQEAKAAAANTGNAIKDSWVTMKVHSQFVPENALEDSDIDVDTKNGVVTLNGTVPTAAGKARAVAIAKATDGVKSVTDNLRVAAAVDTTAAAREAGREVGRDTKEAARDTKEGAKRATGTTGKAMSDGWVKSKIAAQF